MRQTLGKTGFFIKGTSARSFETTTVEGHSMAVGRPIVKPLVVGEKLVILEILLPKGRIDPPHNHPDHDSAGYLIRGKLRLIIDGREFIAEPGDSWYQPAGIEHSSEALTEVLKIEVKSPPIRTWSEKIAK